MPIPEILRDRLRLPVIGAPMFIVSTPAPGAGAMQGRHRRLVSGAECAAGLAARRLAGARSPRNWRRTSARTRTSKVAPFAVNQIVHSSNDRLEQDVALCVKHRVPIIITSLRPPAEVVAAVHGYGGIVFHDVINLRHAEKAAAQGVDGIIAVCAGAGGHAGVLSPFALVKQIREVYAGTIILSGAMSTGADVLAAQALGADLAYLGTRFIATEEAQRAAPSTSKCSSTARAEDIVYTSLFSGVAGNYLRGSVARAGLDPDKLPEADKTKMNFGTGGNTAAQGVAGHLERRPKRQRHSRGRERWRRWSTRMAARVRGGAREPRMRRSRELKSIASERRTIARRAGPRLAPASTSSPATSRCWSARPRTPIRAAARAAGYADRTRVLHRPQLRLG